MTGTEQPTVDLTNCDKEPIHLLGAIQAFGCLVALSADWFIVHVSENIADFAGQEPDDLLGHAANDIFSAEALHALRSRLQWLQTADTSERLLRVDLFGDGRHFDISLHLSGPLIVVEAEPSDDADQTDAIAVVRSMMSRLSGAKDLNAFIDLAARQIRFVTGFDRVMVYRFLPDGAGEVIAESRVSSIDSFMGLRYPASDIPKQARALYVRNLVRLIADVDGAIAPLVPPGSPEGQPLDLSMSSLRSVSPIHLEYLRNMGVGASFSISIIVDGKLWGLFACHHNAPRRIPFDRRTIAELFVQMFALELSNREREEHYQSETRARDIHDRIMSTIAVDGSAFANLSGYLDHLTDIVGCDGVGLWIDGQFASTGRALNGEEMRSFTRFLNRTGASRVFASNEIARQYDGAAAFADRVAGVLSIPVSRSPRDYLVFFRGEVAQSVTWAGNPEKPVELGPLGERLTPRKSFQAWKEEVRGQSEPWTATELRIGESLRTTLLEIILRSIDQSEELRKKAEQKQDLLIGELNHRVRNILTLIRGIVSQTGNHAESVSQFAEILGGRVQALARAHDQLTAENWSPAPLRSLIENEVAAYGGEGGDRVVLSGSAVLLSPQAFSCLALVLHEMVTNAAKYGALSAQHGRLEISWRIDDDDALTVDWQETGGPAVKSPKRRGFGSTLIDKSIPFELKGQASVDYAVTGVMARFVIPGQYVWAGLVTEQAAEAPASSPRQSAIDENARALLVEDNVVIALDVEDMLLELGFAEVVSAGNVGRALQILEEGLPSFALLDVNLGEETSLPVADVLLKANVPFAFASGYGDHTQLPDTFRSVPILTKPYTMANLRQLHDSLMDR